MTEQQAAAALLADNSAYHNHKEQMAYLGAAAYIGAAAVFMFSSRHLPLRWPSLLLLGWTAIAGLLYVGWQLCRRDDAAKAAQAYYSILVRSLPEAEVSRGRFPRKPATLLPKVLMILTMLFWAIGAFCSAVWPSWV